VVQAGFLWRHTFRRRKYPPAFLSHLPTSYEPCPRYPIRELAAHEAPLDKRLALRSTASAPFFSFSRLSYCNTSCAFCLFVSTLSILLRLDTAGLNIVAALPPFPSPLVSTVPT
jgi:hypothetical protein